MVIALVGMCGAGKSSVAKLLEKYNYRGVYFGGITIAEIKNKGLLVTPKNERMVRESLRKREGMDVFAKKSFPAINKLMRDGHKVYIDGLYSYAEYNYLKQHLQNNFVVVEVYANKIERKKRLALRPGRRLTEEEVDERDKSEIELLDKAPPIALSDFKVDNNGSSVATEKALLEVLAHVENGAEL